MNILLLSGVLLFVATIGVFFFIRRDPASRRAQDQLLTSLGVSRDEIGLIRRGLFSSRKLGSGLLENMMHGFIYCKVLYDDGGEAVDYVYLGVNKSYESFTGLRDLIGKKVSQVVAGLKEADPGLFETIGRVSRSGNPERFETFVDALHRWYSVSMYCPRNGYFIALVDNVTERKTAEKKLFESEQRFRVLIENSSDAILLLNREMEIKYESRSAQRITGGIGEGKLNTSWLENIHSEDVQKLRIAFGESTRSQENPVSFQSRIHHKNGHYIWVEGSVANLLEDPNVCAFVVNYRDITLRKSLEEEHALLVSIVNSSDAAILSKTLDGTITSWNPAAQKLFGYASHEIIGRNVSVLIPHDRQDEESGIIRKIKHAKVVEHYETQRVRKDGSIVHILLTVSPVLDDNGVIIGASKIARDISERRTAAEKLEASEQRFRALIENSYDAIVMNDMESKILYQSPSVTRILGYTQEERAGTKVNDYIHPEDREDFEKLYQNLKKRYNEPLPFEYRFRQKNGEFIWIEGVVTNLLNNSSVKAVVANYRDVTARKIAQESLKLTLSRFEQAQQVAHLGHWEFDFETCKVKWSDETFRIFGLEPNSQEPSDEMFLSFVHPDDIEEVKKEILVSRKTFAPFSIYHRIVWENGSIKCLLSVGRYEFDKSNQPVRHYGISLDITELREKEKKLEEVNKDLATFIYKSSHDLKSPIASILGLINIARLEIKDHRALDYLAMVNDVVLKQDKMLRNLIEVMSIRDRKLSMGPIRMKDVFDEVMTSLKGLKRFPDVRFSFHDELRNPACADRELILIIFYHLIENSILYSRQVDPETTIRTTQDEAGNLLIEVCDNGIGIANQSLNRVFDMFYRGAISSKGSGLGLYLVKNAVDRMRGNITVVSEEREGTKFTITIPLWIS